MSFNFKLTLPTDVVTFGKPFSPDHIASLVIGTYNLQPDSNKKHGSINIFSISQDIKVDLCQSIENIGAVLDIQWCSIFPILLFRINSESFAAAILNTIDVYSIVNITTILTT